MAGVCLGGLISYVAKVHYLSKDKHDDKCNYR